MECPVCYCEKKCVHFMCGHDMCHTCTETWCKKSTQKCCPLCRTKIYFKGMRKFYYKWNDEYFENVINDAIIDVYDVWDEFDIDDLLWVETTISKIRRLYHKYRDEIDPDIIWDMLDEVDPEFIRNILKYRFELFIIYQAFIILYEVFLKYIKYLFIVNSLKQNMLQIHNHGTIRST